MILWAGRPWGLLEQPPVRNVDWQARVLNAGNPLIRQFNGRVGSKMLARSVGMIGTRRR